MVTFFRRLILLRQLLYLSQGCDCSNVQCAVYKENKLLSGPSRPLNGLFSLKFHKHVPCIFYFSQMGWSSIVLLAHQAHVLVCWNALGFHFSGCQWLRNRATCLWTFHSGICIIWGRSCGNFYFFISCAQWILKQRDVTYMFFLSCYLL